MTAASMDIDFIQMDVVLSSDKTPWINHDPGLLRTTNAETDFKDRKSSKMVFRTFFNEAIIWELGKKSLPWEKKLSSKQWPPASART